MTMKLTPKEFGVKDQRLNSRDIAVALGMKGPWVVYGVKKSNRILAAQGKEELIFAGRYSTPGKVALWLDTHPNFVAGSVLAPVRKTGKSKSPLRVRSGAKLEAYDKSLQVLVSELESRIPAAQLAGAFTVWRAICAKRRWPYLPPASRTSSGSS